MEYMEVLISDFNGTLQSKNCESTDIINDLCPTCEKFWLHPCSALLQRQQSMLSSLSSPYIISCLGYEISGDFYSLFLELAEGGTLSDLAGRLDEPKIQSFNRQILLGLSYLHSNGIAHRDVKGRNVLLCSEAIVKLADFGCARRVGDGGRSVMLTPTFMAPEVVRGSVLSYFSSSHQRGGTGGRRRCVVSWVHGVGDGYREVTVAGSY
ncbi:hypothetical protein M5K25_008220 [Dendrobium thyrsiflorum]|uniref:Protein kinase domain-containing protein n=1 Tax=Dendrobium thyrsiflorum TaxID=117978 RepID=A0ABD0V998_DENTH